ncbi:D-alanyl-lipoteichoic acid biosynthesis protein DltD [Paradesulfitobacterium ferrireducens]|uniref:D-alanyl-lipoteichoic acid biosynthesis protein DltD n=1 Tax=Paradesulfitobacterium ferrireducens TaxID=2816476 RepID=UPI001A90AAFF|nr:D-alanyl-lipoteichoic acid biosynthesis protein DltD [Paradesulfitobacterium ferrireducens]
MGLFRRLSPALAALLLLVLTILYGGPLSRWAVQRYLFDERMVQGIAAAQNTDVFKGTVIRDLIAARDDTFTVYGSSEFSAWSEFHPSSLFAGEPTGFYPFLIGRGGCQDLIHTINIASQAKSLQGKKVAIVLSLQWFSPEGLSSDYFASNFSALQTYDLLFNRNLPAATKKQIAKRLLDFHDSLASYPFLTGLLTSVGADDDANTRFTYPVYRSLGQIEYAGLQIKDSIKSAIYLWKVKQSLKNNLTSSPPPKLQPWSTYLNAASAKGQASVSNNPFGVKDDYYLTYVKPNLASAKNASKNARTYPSPEYQDLSLLLTVLKEQGAQALFVIVPVNGFWYDYTGFPAKERNGYYTRVKNMISEQGFRVADFSNKEYESYFLQDIMHVGWKGWVYIDQALDEFFHSQ